MAQQEFFGDDCEIIVINDCSPEDYTEFFLSDFPFAYFQRKSENRGLAVARNRRIELTRGGYLVFTDMEKIDEADRADSLFQ